MELADENEKTNIDLEKEDDDDDDDEENNATEQMEVANASQSINFSEEQLELMRINREKAEKLRLERLKAAQEKAFNSLTNQTDDLSDERRNNEITIVDVHVGDTENIDQVKTSVDNQQSKTDGNVDGNLKELEDIIEEFEPSPTIQDDEFNKLSNANEIQSNLEDITEN